MQPENVMVTYWIIGKLSDALWLTKSAWAGALFLAVGLGLLMPQDAIPEHTTFLDALRHAFYVPIELRAALVACIVLSVMAHFWGWVLHRQPFLEHFLREGIGFLVRYSLYFFALAFLTLIANAFPWAKTFGFGFGFFLVMAVESGAAIIQLFGSPRRAELAYGRIKRFLPEVLRLRTSWKKAVDGALDDLTGQPADNTDGN